MTSRTATSDDLAQALLEVVPMVMRAIRTEMRGNRDAALSVPQFRVLSYVRHNGSVSLSLIAEHLGLTPPSVSAMVDCLVARGCLDRRPDDADRRKVAIALTKKGGELWAAAYDATRASFVRRLGGLGAAQREVLAAGMETLRLAFADAQSVSEERNASA